MYQGKKILALIPARGGSKGIKDKNIIDLCGKPLIAYSIECGLQSKYIDSVVVTTDSEKIAEVSRQYGARVPFLRPAEYAQDTSTTLVAVLHAVNTLKEMGESYDALLLLQPTQPLRTSEDVDKAIEAYFENGEEDLVSVSLVSDHPLHIRTVEENGKLKKLLDSSSTCRRQDMPPFYRVNGCIYINNLNELNDKTSFNDNSVPYIMEQSHSVDIDDLADFYLAEYYLGSIGKNKESVM